ncbi:uncharacterized protein LOC114164658 [Vigna unguiculata]|uniref:Uncharacterized protein n=1 Tax=Vigna unguiculata TaxID=3917 RepID=A0A4D6NHB3_VIGUN|nr:uncharacterized protein LOC114164658 [Vigna unguiculata]QCE13233.1 hypothetical protein DEO72_LG11g226 [Vigna unguiculata]
MAYVQVHRTNLEVDDFLVREIEKLRNSIMESLQDEKQIMVDPLSLKGSSPTQGYLESSTMLPTIITTSSSIILHPPPLQPPKPRFLSRSLPNSANSSPRFASKKKPKGESAESQREEAGNLTHKLQHFPEKVRLKKSNSCGEATAHAPSDEFDHWLSQLSKLSAMEHDKWYHENFFKTEAVRESPKSVKLKHVKTLDDDDGFKCSALCLYLPGFGSVKEKLVKIKREESEKGGKVMSRTVSLENFECGSWSSAAIPNEIEGDCTNSYFDLPIELMKCSSSKVHSPIASPFVLDRDHLKGILKNGSCRGSVRKSDASPRHVRFSTSSASQPASPVTCISPRLRKAREDFNAFLAAAQTA